MNHYISSRVTQEDIAKEMRRKAAVAQSGYAFFVLQLIDYSKRRVSGVDVLDAIPGERMGTYTFEVNSRQLEFSFDHNQGCVCAHVLDTEGNRKFLASHLDGDYWEIIAVISGRKHGRVLDLNAELKSLENLRDELIEKTRKDNERRQAELQAKKERAINLGKPRLLPEDTNVKDISKLSDEALLEELKRREHDKKIDVQASIPVSTRKDVAEMKKKTVINTDISEEEFKKLSPAEKRKITIARKKSRSAVVVSKKQSDVVVSNKKEVVESGGAPDSMLLSPIGMQQP
jgi:hypothetical protein